MNRLMPLALVIALLACSRASTAGEPAAPAPASPTEAGDKTDMLMLIAADADKAPTPAERKKFLIEFLKKSQEAIQENADAVPLSVWVARATAAVELNDPEAGWAAGRRLKEMGVADSNESKIRHAMAQLRTRDWLGDAVPSAPKELTVDCGNDVSMKLAFISQGEFMMGRDEPPEQVIRNCGGEKVDFDWFPGELPQHRVKIAKPFYMGVYVVTQAQYQAVTGANPSRFKGDNNPVEMVSWYDAAEFCKKLSQKSGMTIRLPTEAEWEYACRAGTSTPFNTGETISTDQANYDGNSTYGSGRKGECRRKTVLVGSFAPNAFGLYDMHGNVWEWCVDFYHTYPAPQTADSEGTENNGQWRVLRGGSWLSSPGYCRSANRIKGRSENRVSLVGFRVVCELPKQ